MDDETKAAVERFRSIIEEERAQMDAETFAALWGSEAVVLAHIDGESERIAAKAEEVREACARHLARVWYGLPDGGVAALGTVACVRTTPLDATPLADRIAELEQQKVDLKTMIQGLRTRAEKAEARVEELEAQAATDDDHALVVNDAHLKTVAALRRRVAWLEAQWDEAVAALRRLVGASAMLLGRFQRLHDSDVLREVNEQPTDDALEHARAVLAKYPEGR